MNEDHFVRSDTPPKRERWCLILVLVGAIMLALMPGEKSANVGHLAEAAPAAPLTRVSAQSG